MRNLGVNEKYQKKIMRKNWEIVNLNSGKEYFS